MRDALATIKFIHPFLDSRKKFNPLGDFIERNFVGQLANGIQSNLFLRHVANISGHQTQSKPEYRGRRSGLFVAFVIVCKNTNSGGGGLPQRQLCWRICFRQQSFFQCFGSPAMLPTRWRARLESTPHRSRRPDSRRSLATCRGVYPWVLDAPNNERRSGTDEPWRK